MDEKLAGILIEKTFENPYNEERFWYLMKSIFYETKKKDDVYNAQNDKIESCRILFEYKTKEALDENIDILVVKMKTLNSLEKARSSQRNFVATYLQQRRKQAVLVAFYTDEDDGKEWRFSFVKKDSSYDFEKNKKNDKFTPAKRYSYLVGENENSHTAKTYLHKLLKDNDDIPTLQELEDAFAIEKVSKDFFTEYKNLYLRLFDVIEDLRNKNSSTGFDFLKIDSDLFCKKTLGQIVFLYFLQKKGWLGVPLDKDWSQGDKSFMRTLFEKAKKEGKNYFNDYLEPLFYKALAERNPKDWYEELKCKIPFLNGGLFEPINSYDWEKKFVVIPNKLFSNENKDGILDILDIYNFTVKEDEPLEKEVAIDPEMLGQIFENLLDIKDRKKDGAFYTPREIVHYMCQESLINYLYTKINYKQISINGELPIGDTLLNQSVKIERKDIEDFICHGDISSFIKQFAKEINEALRTVKVCDPAIGSGAFPVGMMHEVISARRKLVDEKCLPEAQKRSSYAYKKDFIKNSLYGVDIEKSAVEIAKLRLWLSLIVDEDDKKNIEPLPNLDYKLVQGNSLLSIDKKSKGANQALLEDIERDKDIVFNESLKRNKLRLKNKINKNLETFYEIYNKFHDENPVSFDFEIHFSEVFRQNKGFDIVIGNPPYVGEKGNKEIFQAIAKGNLGKFYQGKMDLFYFFFHLALEIGRKNAQNAFITTNYYISAFGGKKLRTDLKERAIIRNLINFNELRIFESAKGQHNLITIFSKEQNSEKLVHTCITSRTGNANEKILNMIVSERDKETQYYKISQEELYSGNNIKLTNGRTDDILDEIAKNTRLKK